MQKSQKPIKKYLYKSSIGSKVLRDLSSFLYQWNCFECCLPENSKSQLSTEILLCMTHDMKRSMGNDRPSHAMAEMHYSVWSESRHVNCVARISIFVTSSFHSK